MNSFETDIKRAIISKGFLAGFLVELFILWKAGGDSELFRVSVPVIATFPYATAWLSDYQSGYIKLYLPRSGRTSYICGKFFACGLAGGLVEFLPYLVYLKCMKDAVELKPGLIFCSAMLWAFLAATLAAVSNSRYIAYGGSFVIYYILVILHDRYFERLYCLYPYEWFQYRHSWIFDEQGIVILLGSLSVLLFFVYFNTVRRCIERV